MVISLKFKNHILFFIICSSLNILFTKETYKNYNINIKIEESLGNLYIINKNDTLCEKWIPSLFSPVLLIDSKKEIQGKEQERPECRVWNPIISTKKDFKVIFYNYKLFGEYSLLLSKETFGNNVKDCYFGLSSGIGNYSALYNNETTLNYLENNKEISHKIFSFNKWIIKDSSIDINFYFGDEHENFINSTNGIIGKCNTNESDYFWSCQFKEMSYNNTSTQLINPDDKQFYKIYFSSEDHTIIFPSSFKSKFKEITKNSCEYENPDGIACKNLFNSDNYFHLKLIDDNMTITIEIDNKLRFNKVEDTQFQTNIIFKEEVDYFILPLIVFKQFHVQFNAEKNIINFFTTDKSILELKEKDKEDEPKNDGNESNSNAGTVVLIIVIILIILALGFGIFWFLRIRKNSAEKNINKYNKFEEDDNFKDMSEKRVF